MTEALPVHHRVVIAIEATALAVPYLPVFKKLVVAQLLQHLKQASFEVAIVTFATRDGTARSCLTTTPWTGYASVVDAWMNAIPTLLEGTGTAAAQEALAEALSMLEQPSELTPVDDSTTVEREIVMLWLSEGPFTSALVMSPDVASNPHYQGYKMPLTMVSAPRMSFSAFTPNHLGSKRSIVHIESEYSGRTPNNQKEALFSVALCSCVPEMVAHIMHGSSQVAVSRAVVQAIRQQIVNDPELRKQHKAASAIYRRGGASAAQAADKRSAQHLSATDASNAQLNKTAKTGAGGAVARSAAMANQPQRPGPAPSDATGHSATGTQAVANTAVPLNQPERRKHPAVSWHGSIVVNEKGVPQVMVQRAELSVSAADSILSKAPSPNTWTTSIDLMGTVRKTSEFSAAVHNMRRDQYGKVLVKVDETTLKKVFARYQAEVIVLAPCPGHAIVIPHLPVKSNDPMRLGLYMTEATRAAHFPFMKKL